jgi:hypothetical protein
VLGAGNGELLSSITNNGCFVPGAQFNLWVDADAATKSYMANIAFTIDPNVRRQGRACAARGLLLATTNLAYLAYRVFVGQAGWCTVDVSGTVDDIKSSLTDDSNLTPMQTNMLCVYKPGVYVVSSYQLWASESCQFNFAESSNCNAMISLPACFTQGTTFNLWVNVRWWMDVCVAGWRARARSQRLVGVRDHARPAPPLF